MEGFDDVIALQDVDISANGVAYGTGIWWYIRYGIPTLSSGSVTFEVSGCVEESFYYKGVLLTMWSESDGYDYNTVPYIFELRRYGYVAGRDDVTDALKIKMKVNDTWAETDYAALSWDPQQTYTFDVTWGDSIVRVYRDSVLYLTLAYPGEFVPNDHVIQIGSQPFRSRPAPAGLWVSGVRIRAF